MLLGVVALGDGGGMVNVWDVDARLILKLKLLTGTRAPGRVGTVQAVSGEGHGPRLPEEGEW